MRDVAEPNEPSFLEATEVIDWRHPAILHRADELWAQSTDQTDFICRAFEWVRDEIRHTSDYQLERVTCVASEVLQHRTGFCYAKSHLLAALYRAKGIPAGFGYQRLSIDGKGPPFCLHGFVVVDLGDRGWRRIDPRGNKPGITTNFCLTSDSLAFTPSLTGERTFPEVYAEPLKNVIEALTEYQTSESLCNNLPDAPATCPVN